MALSTSATESLLQAVDIIASSKIGEMSYDKTIICTIVDNSEAERRGFYTVTDGKVRFKAYTTVTTYKVGDSIRVTIPNGDFNSKKYIDGLNAKDDDSPITYVSSLDSFLSMADLIPPEEQNVDFGLIANKIDINNPNGILIKTINLNESSYSDLQQNGIYDAIGISADFKCLLGQKDIRGGNYGLRIDMKIKLNTRDNYIIKTYYLDSDEMFGNPYNFIAASTQEKMFNTITLGVVEEISLYFYQKNNFTYYDIDSGNALSLEVANEPNIFLNRIQVSFGTNIENVEDNTLKLYSSSSLDFNYKNSTDQTNTKNIGLLWYNKNDLNQYLGFSDGIVDFNEDKSIRHYDEIEYLELTKKNARLASQVGKEGIPKDEAGLMVAALVDEAFIFIEELKVLLDQDLTNLLENYCSKFATNFPEGASIISKDLNWLRQQNNNFISILTSNFDNKKEYFKNKLNYVSKINDKENKPNNPDPENIRIEDENGNEIISGTLFEFITNQKNIFNDKFFVNNIYAPILQQLIQKDEYKYYKGSYDSFVNQLSKVVSLINNKFDQIQNSSIIVDKDSESGIESSMTLENALRTYREGLNYGVYIPIDEDQYANRYCIYWYRYTPGYIDPSPEKDFAGSEWQRIVPDETEIQVSSLQGDTKKIKYNLGLPLKYNTNKETQITYWDKKPEDDYGLLKIYLNPIMHQEKFKAVLFYNHEKYESEPIIFYNLDDLNAINSDKNNALSIQHMDNSSDTYQSLYGKNNFLINAAESKKARKIKAVYNGALGTTDEVLLDGTAQICWYIPRENSMLDVDYEFMIKPESEGGGGFTTNYAPTYKVRDSIWEKIQKIIEALKGTYKENYYKHFWILQDKPYISQNSEAENIIQKYNYKEFGFNNDKIAFLSYKKVGNYISLDPTYSMKSLKRDGGTLTHGGQWLPIFTRLPKLDKSGSLIIGSDGEPILEDNEEQLIEEIKSEFNKDGYYYFYKLIKLEEDTCFYYQIKNYYQHNDANNKIICVVKKDEEQFEASLNITFGSKDSLGSDYNFIIKPSGLATAVHEDNPLQIDIELFDYNNVQIPIFEHEYDSNSGAVYLKANDNKVFHHWIGGNNAYSLDLKEDQNNTVIGGEITCNDLSSHNIGALLQLTAKFNNASSSESSPDGAGTDYKKQRLSDIGTFFSVPYASSPDYYIEGATSIIYDNNGNNPEYYKDSYKLYDRTTGDIVPGKWRIKYYSYNSNNNQFNEVPESDSDFCKNYLPVLSDRATLIPCATYLDNGNASVNYYPFIQYHNKDNANAIIWSQPIIVMKNRYATSMSNEADSTLAINTKSGSILNSMMNAFRRGSGNDGKSIEGFLIGEMQYNNSSDKQLGLFGFTDGLQSFAFNVNGDVSLGIPGSGQINFKGGEGIISSTSNIEGENSGLTINLQDGIIDIFSTYKDQEDTQKLDGGKGFFGTSLTTPLYKKPEGNVTSSRIYMNASSAKAKGYSPPATNNGIPSWWKTYSSWFPQNGQKSVAPIADDKADPLFAIQVPNANKDGRNDLIKISDIDCLIQSNNYTAGKYQWGLDQSKATGDDKAQGMKIDLQYGFIDAYKLKISSNNILINSSGDDDPLFVVRTLVNSQSSQFKNLLFIKDNKNADTTFLLRSKSYEEINGKQTAGMQIDVTNGNITSYDFSLLGKSSDREYNGSYIYITSKNDSDSNKPTIQFHLKDNNGDRDLFKITPNEFILVSPRFDLSGTNANGIKLDIYNGSLVIKNNGNSLLDISNTTSNPTFKLTSPNFNLNNGNGINLDIYEGSLAIKNNGKVLLDISKDNFILQSSNWNSNNKTGVNMNFTTGAITLIGVNNDKKIIIDSTHSDYPFQIGTSSDNGNLTFKIGWDGILNLNETSFNIGSVELGSSTIDGESSLVIKGNIKAAQDNDGNKGRVIADIGIMSNGWLKVKGTSVFTGSGGINICPLIGSDPETDKTGFSIYSTSEKDALRISKLESGNRTTLVQFTKGGNAEFEGKITTKNSLTISNEEDSNKKIKFKVGSENNLNIYNASGNSDIAICYITADGRVSVQSENDANIDNGVTNASLSTKGGVVIAKGLIASDGKFIVDKDGGNITATTVNTSNWINVGSRLVVNSENDYNETSDGKSRSGLEIKGGALIAKGLSVGNGNFIVDKDGNVMIQNQTLEAFIKDKANSGGSIEIPTDPTFNSLKIGNNFSISNDGSITKAGSITTNGNLIIQKNNDKRVKFSVGDDGNLNIYNTSDGAMIYITSDGRISIQSNSDYNATNPSLVSKGGIKIAGGLSVGNGNFTADKDGNITKAKSITTAGALTAGSITTSGALSSGALTASSITTSGTLTLTAKSSGNTKPITISGNNFSLNAAGELTAGSITVGNDVFHANASGNIKGGALNLTSNSNWAGNTPCISGSGGLRLNGNIAWGGYSANDGKTYYLVMNGITSSNFSGLSGFQETNGLKYIQFNPIKITINDVTYLIMGKKL